MTHIAARHSIISLSINFMLSIVLGMGRMFLIHSFKSNDQEYQRL
ncbi:MAG: hypothetical protein GY777_08570, partial [Candidatus Brocadiaceae bacterium]|nr:hypothetical protein [Candidatus Brocadiaceae bacterium]